MSQYFEWDAAKYSIHVPKMDAEHQDIINCMNKLHTLHAAKAPVAQAAKALGDLARVTIAHFADEEAYMASIAFPGSASTRSSTRTCSSRSTSTRPSSTPAAS